MAILKNLKSKIELNNELNREKIKEAEKELKKEGVDVERMPEKKIESIQEKRAFELEEQAGGPEVAAGFAAGQSAIQKRKEQEKQIESILAKDMEDMYLSMSPVRQQEFKRTGEQTAREINTILTKTKVKVKKIIDLIKKWLSIIPGINKFFLEQESKIKADEILKIKQQHGK